MYSYLIMITVSITFIWACSSGVSQVEYDKLREDLTLSKVTLDKANTDLATKESEVKQLKEDLTLSNVTLEKANTDLTTKESEVKQLKEDLDSYKGLESNTEDVTNVLQYWKDTREVDAALYQTKGMQVLLTEGLDGLYRLSDDELQDFMFTIELYPEFKNVRINNSKLYNVVSKQIEMTENSGLKSLNSGDVLGSVVEELSEEDMVQLDVEVYQIMINMLKK